MTLQYRKRITADHMDSYVTLHQFQTCKQDLETLEFLNFRGNFSSNLNVVLHTLLFIDNDPKYYYFLDQVTSGRLHTPLETVTVNSEGHSSVDLS